MLVDVPRRGHAAELLPQLLEERQQFLPRGEAPRHQPGLPLRAITATEVLDHRLRMHSRFWVGRELPHRRRAPQPFRGLHQLGEDLVVGVALADSGLELGEGLAIDIGDCAVDGLAHHSAIQNRAFARLSKCAHISLNFTSESRLSRLAQNATASRGIATGSLSSTGRMRSRAATHRGQNWLPAACRSSSRASAAGLAAL